MSEENRVAMAHRATTNDNAGIVYALLAVAESVDRLTEVYRREPGGGALPMTTHRRAKAEGIAQAYGKRPYLMTYTGVRVDQDDYLWGLYLRSGEDPEARETLYKWAGSGGWDDVCEHCPKHRYEHGGSDHVFISEEK